MKAIGLIIFNGLADQPSQDSHMLRQENLDGRVRLRSVSYAGSPGDRPLVQSTKHMCLTLCGVSIILGG